MIWIILAAVVIMLVLSFAALMWSLARAGRDTRPDDWPPTPFDE